MTVVQFRSDFVDYIINPIMAALFVAAMIVFLWGVVQFLGYLTSNSNNKEQGKRHMLWGIVGIFIMASAIAIINLALNTIGAPSVENLTPPSQTLGD